MNNNTDFTEGFCTGHEKALQHVQEIIKKLWDEERRDNTDRAILLTELSHKVDGLRMDERP